MNYSILNHNQAQILEVHSLRNEIDNKKILSSVDTSIDDGNSNFVVDLGSLDYINSIGINFLISMMKKSEKSGGALRLINVSAQIEKLLHITKLSNYFHIKSDLEQALESFQHE